MRHSGHPCNITQCIHIIGESLHASDSRGGAEQEIFWQQQLERMIYNAVEVIKRAAGKISAADPQWSVVGAAQSRYELSSDDSRQGFNCPYLEGGHNAKKKQLGAGFITMSKGSFENFTPTGC